VTASRRHFARMTVDLPAQYAIGELPHWENCSIVNIGPGGVRLQTLNIIGGGATVSIRFEFEGMTIAARTRIVESSVDRVRGNAFSSATFTTIDPEVQDKIEQRVAELRAAGQS
jgi:hypothetical protein